MLSRILRRAPNIYSCLCLQSFLQINNITPLLFRTVALNMPRTHQILTNYLPLAPNTIWDNPGARRRRKRVGRGPGSGKGKTSGRGMKGKNAKGKGFHPRYEGGQNPLQRRVPKSGVTKRSWRYEPTTYVNIDKIMYYISKGKLNPSEKITIKNLFECGAISNPKYGVCLLGRGGHLLKEMKMPNGIDAVPPLHIEVNSATAPAIDLIKKSGGKVTCMYHTKLTLRNHIKPEKKLFQSAIPQPPPRIMVKLEKLREKGADVIYTPTEWFANKSNRKMLAKREELQKTREERLRALGEGIKYRPMFSRKLDYFASKGKKKSKQDKKTAKEQALKDKEALLEATKEAEKQRKEDESETKTQQAEQ